MATSKLANILLDALEDELGSTLTSADTARGGARGFVLDGKSTEHHVKFVALATPTAACAVTIFHEGAGEKLAAEIAASVELDGRSAMDPLAAHGLAASPAVLFTGRLLVGLGAAVTFTGALKIAGSWFPPSQFGMMSAVTATVGVLGALIGNAPLAALAAGLTWRGALIIIGAVTLAGALLCVAVVRDHPPVLPDVDLGIDDQHLSLSSSAVTGSSGHGRARVWIRRVANERHAAGARRPTNVDFHAACSRVEPVSNVVARRKSRGSDSSCGRPRCMVQRLSQMTTSPTRQRWL